MFINERLLDEVSYGLRLGPSFDVSVDPLKNGAEARNGNNDVFRWKGDAPYDNIKPAQYEVILGAFLSCRSMLHSFRVKNHFDYVLDNQPLGLAPAGSTPVQLYREYELFGVSYQKTLTKPVDGTIVVMQDGVVKATTTDPLTGLITPTTAWTEGAVLTVSGEFDVPMRFDNEWLPFSYDEYENINGSVQLIEVLFE